MTLSRNASIFTHTAIPFLSTFLFISINIEYIPPLLICNLLIFEYTLHYFSTSFISIRLTDDASSIMMNPALSKGSVDLRISLRACLLSLLGSAILAFGLYNVHAFSVVTEGGMLGVTLFLHHWFAISPSLSGLIINALCYLAGWRTLGNMFIFYSIIAGGGFSVFYAIFEQYPQLWPQLAHMPLTAAIVGALFVGVGVGLSVRAGGAPGGDDALAMTLGKLLHQPIERIYLISDLCALALCSTYLPLENLACSLLTVVLSGQIIGVIQRIPTKKQ